MKDNFQPVENYLPHRAPMVLLDKVLAWDVGKVSTGLTIQKTSPFFIEGEGVPAYVGLEYMAQACGIFAGIEATRLGQPVELGFLLGTRNFRSVVTGFSEGCGLVVEAEEVFRQDGMGVFDCRILCEKNEIASARLNVYRHPSSRDDNSNDN